MTYPIHHSTMFHVSWRELTPHFIVTQETRGVIKGVSNSMQPNLIDAGTVMKTIGERIAYARRQKKWSQEKLAEACGWSGQSRISSYERNVTEPNKEYMKVLAQALGVSEAWLWVGDPGSSIVAFESVSETIARYDSPRLRLRRAKAEQPSDEFVAVQRVHLKLSAGVTGYEVNTEGENGKPIFFRRDFLDERGWRPEKLIALRVNGDSMEPGLFDHDVVVINTAETEPLDSEVFAVNYEGEAVIKRLNRDSGEWWLTSDNPDKRRYPDKKCHEGTILIGRAVYKQSERI